MPIEAAVALKNQGNEHFKAARFADLNFLSG
jgi:hypothetical protein